MYLYYYKVMPPHVLSIPPNNKQYIHLQVCVQGKVEAVLFDEIMLDNTK